MTQDHVKVSLDDGVMTIQLNRPQVLNALNATTVHELNAAVDRAAEEARAVVLTGDAKSFSSGADLTDGALAEAGAVDELLGIINTTVAKLRDLEVPTIAAVSGPAAGVGCSYALICDMVVMDPGAYLMLAFTQIGLMPDGGATALVAASAGRHRALRMALNAEKIYADTAYEWGLATEVTEEGQYLARAQEIAAQFAAGPTVALGKASTAINQASLPQLDEAFATERAGQSALRETADFAEGTQAFMEKRRPKFVGK